MTNRGYSAYANTKANTASPGDLILMLYDGAIRFGNLAMEAIEKKEIEKAHINIVKIENIIKEFQASLDFKYPVANEFNNVYTYLLQRLIEANMKKDNEIMEEVMGHLRTMRDTWKEVMKLSKQEKKVV
ncbi:MAG: flagellar export chaperone FliS [Lachnospiraceae bacterium]|nr:flagellar export chaperone FliS [Lachnospiraceae bacterium]MCR5082261.1 flagellar export chaperone FliS [Parasporobacterium sp.]